VNKQLQKLCRYSKIFGDGLSRFGIIYSSQGEKTGNISFCWHSCPDSVPVYTFTNRMQEKGYRGDITVSDMSAVLTSDIA
jgi:hypothetical protein